MSWFVAFSFIWAMCIAVGAIFAFVGICNLILAKASLAWPTTQGKVQSSSVVTLHDSEGGYNLDHAVVIYEFNVNNNAFIGKRIAFGYTNGDTISNPRRAQEIVDRYPQDKNVTVYYICPIIQRNVSLKLVLKEVCSYRLDLGCYSSLLEF